MTYLNLSYDYAAAFFLLMLMIWYITEKKVPLKSYRFFFYVIICAFLATTLEIATFEMVRFPDLIPYRVSYTVMSWHMFFLHGFVTCLAYCMLGMAHVDVRKNRKLMAVFVTSWIMLTVICLFNPQLRWAATLRVDGYRETGVGYLLFLVDICMLIIIFGLIIKRNYSYKFLTTPLIVFLVICATVAAVVQAMNYALMLNLIITVFLLVMYLFQQSPDAVTDKLTGQFSRLFLGEYLKDCFIEEKIFSVILVDLDDFKFINQSYGIEVGDVLLNQVGKYLESMKSSGLVFHYDADQFCVIVDRRKYFADVMAREIKGRFAFPWKLENHEVMMSATICIVDCPEDANNAENLVDVIEYAMEEAKKNKKGQITHAHEVELEKIHMAKSIEKIVKAAIATDKIMVYYQPIYSVEKKGFRSAEALARLYDEKLGWIPPDEFIVIAERSGLIIELGEMILHKVCRFIRDNNLAQTPIEYIEINVSPIQLMQKGFASKMLEIMKQYNVAPSQINVEITENAMMTAFSVVDENLRKLVDNQVAVSLDDYGSGYATINYINKLPFELIKIDRAIVQDSFKEKKAGITLEHTVSMLNALELDIVAEGVETEEMRDLLVKFGCHYLQGWYYSKAVSETEFMQFISKGK